MMTRALQLRTAPLFACIAHLALGTGLILATPALADDARLVDHEYQDNEVVTIYGRTSVQATIAFGKDEAIENVAVGDSAKWQITPNKRADLLFVKPLEATARTNMTVVTNKHTYFFDLIAAPKARALYMLRFTYKEEPVEDVPATGPSREERLAGLDPAERGIVEGDPLSMPSDVSALNFAWTRSGDASLQPTRIYDDGVSTFLVWPELKPVPAILVENEKGDEGPVNYAVRGPTIVVAEVPDKIILRNGEAMAQLVNTLPMRTRPQPTVAQGGSTPVPAY